MEEYFDTYLVMNPSCLDFVTAQGYEGLFTK